MNEALIARVKKVYKRYHGPSKSSFEYLSNKWNVGINTRKVGQELAHGTYGSVHELGTDKRYVIKRMDLGSDDMNLNLLRTFTNELRVGTTPRISQVGPKIYGWRVFSDSDENGNDEWFGEYIMDNVLHGETELVSQTLAQYVTKWKPGPEAPLFKKLKTTLRNFWLITKGYHGDLHGGNIAVVSRPDGTVVRVMIYDYGAHKRTKVRLSPSMTFEQLTEAINKNFARSATKRPQSVSLFPNPKKRPMYTVSSKMYAPTLGQTRRSNANLLRTVNFTTGHIMKNAGPMSLMNVLYRKKKTKLANYYNRSTAIPKTARAAPKPYVSPKRTQKTIRNYFRVPSPPKPKTFTQRSLINYFKKLV